MSLESDDWNPLLLLIILAYMLKYYTPKAGSKIELLKHQNAALEKG